MVCALWNAQDWIMSENIGGPSGPATPNQQQTPQPSQYATQAKNFFDWIRTLKIVRGQDRWLGGVASGIAHRLGIDPVIVRGIVVVSIIFFGIGLFAYGVTWALLPEPDGRIHVQEVAKGRWSAGMTGAAIFVGLAIVPAWRGLLFFSFGTGGWFPWPLLWLAGIAGLIIWAVNSNKSIRSHQPTPPTGNAQADSGTEAAQMTTPYPTPYRPAAEQRFSAPTQAYQGFTPATPAQPSNFTMPTFQPRPVRRSYGPGAATVGATLGLAALVAGGVLLAELMGFLNGPVAPIAWASAAAVCGVGIVVAALRGRSSGALGFFALVALLVSAFFAVIPSNSNWVFARTADWTTQSIADTGSGYSVAAATGNINLQGLNSIGNDLSVPVVVNAGSANIKVPDNIRVVVKNQMWLPNTWINGQKASNSQRDLVLNPNANGPALTLQLQGSVGDVRISSNGSN